MRARTFTYPENSISQYCYDLIASLLRVSRSTHSYVVCGVPVCKAAWAWAHGFSDATCNRMHAKFNRDWAAVNPEESKNAIKQSAINTATSVCDQWLLEWLVLSTHNPPNGTKASVPKVGASVLYPQYTAWCAKAGEYAIQEDGFRGRLSLMKQQLDVATRNSKQGSAECAMCSILKRAEAKTTSLKRKREIKTLRAKHINFVNEEVNRYVKRVMAAKDIDEVLRFVLTTSRM